MPERPASSGSRPDDSIWRVTAQLGDAMQAVFEGLASTRDQHLERWMSSGRSPEALGHEDLRPLGDVLQQALRANSAMLAGAGVVTAPGTLRDTARWLEYWTMPPGGEPTRLDVSLDPHRPDFYDYELASWFAEPRDTGQPCAVGPYVDWLGTNEYVVTLAVPTYDERTFLGVVSADVRVSALEHLVLPEVGDVHGELVLVTGDGRVVVTNSRHQPVGERLEVDDQVTGEVGDLRSTRRFSDATLPEGWAFVLLSPGLSAG